MPFSVEHWASTFINCHFVIEFWYPHSHHESHVSEATSAFFVPLEFWPPGPGKELSTKSSWLYRWRRGSSETPSQSARLVRPALGGSGSVSVNRARLLTIN